jgi:acetyl-CoA C-acetyltransferase/acetyl-CoA acyltransferase 2
MLKSLKAVRSKTPKHQQRFASGGRVFLVSGKRTPFGKFGGSAKDITPVDLTVHCSKAALEEAKIPASDVDHVIFGNVVPATTDTIYGARHTALKLGAKVETPAYNVNRLCGSGIQAIVDAKHLIQRGEADVVVACGAENMSLIPHLTYGTRFGSRLEPFKVVDMLMDSLTDAYCKTPMAITAENLGAKYNITREQVDQYSLESHQKGAAAYKNGHLQGELAPITLKKSKLEADEHLRPEAVLGDMAKLKSVFKENGLVTAATASGIVDGAASVVVVSEAYLKKTQPYSTG